MENLMRPCIDSRQGYVSVSVVAESGQLLTRSIEASHPGVEIDRSLVAVIRQNRRLYALDVTNPNEYKAMQFLCGLTSESDRLVGVFRVAEAYLASSRSERRKDFYLDQVDPDSRLAELLATAE